ncbi:MAG: helix-turn-helix domain-containing protein [Planctomycetota bacterium]|nr:helix-turn-helix domain-containing protein [Planctomycetota bacterium]
MSLHETATKARQKDIEAELAAAGVPAVATPAEATKALGLDNPKTINRMAARGDLVAFRIGNRLRIRRAELARYIVVNEK